MVLTTYPVKKTEPTASIATYLISGGLSSDTLTDLFIDRVEPATFSIDDVSLSYGGTDNIPVPPNADNYKVYFFNSGGVGGVGVAEEAPQSSIIIATFDSDHERITDYRLSGNFAITLEVNKVIEGVNHIIEGDFTRVSETDESITLSWNEPIKIYLPSKAAGSATVNTINVGSINLIKGQIAFVNLNRASNATVTLSKSTLAAVDLDADRQYIFYYSPEGVFTSSVGQDNRLVNLEEVTHEVEIFQSVSASAGTVTIPANATIYTERYKDGASALAVLLDANDRPLPTQPLDSDNVGITATIDTDGNYTLSSEPVAYPVAVVFKIQIKGKHLKNLSSDKRCYIERVEIDPVYNNADPSVITVGGIAAGTTFSNYTFTEFLDDLLYPELFGTLTNPSRTFTSNQTGLREIGDVIDITFNSTFNRGSINPQYESNSPFRAGLPNEYIYTGTGLTSIAKTDLSDLQIVENYTVLAGSQSWTGRIAYDEGVQPKGSKGTEFDSPFPAGQTANISRSIAGVYPYFANNADLTVSTQQSLANHGSVITVTWPMAEEEGNKQYIEVPQVWGDNLTKLEQFNTLSGSFDEIDLNTFTRTSIQKTVLAGEIDYYRFEHNGSTIGGRQLRFTF